jgi:hypothetical protein
MSKFNAQNDLSGWSTGGGKLCITLYGIRCHDIFLCNLVCTDLTKPPRTRRRPGTFHLAVTLPPLEREFRLRLSREAKARTKLAGTLVSDA